MTDSEVKLIGQIAEDYKAVLENAKQMGCKDVRALYNIPLENMELIVQALEKQIKKEKADGCAGCAFEDVEEWEMPCRKCKRNCKDYWRAKER